MLAPMRHTTGGWQQAKAPVAPGKLKAPADTHIGKPVPPPRGHVPPPAQAQTPSQAQAPAQVPPGPRVDSRTKLTLNLDEVVEGYLLRDVVRVQRYPYNCYVYIFETELP
jgi:hypothetical protein